MNIFQELLALLSGIAKTDFRVFLSTATFALHYHRCA